MSAIDITNIQRIHDGYLKVDRVTVEDSGNPITNNVMSAKDGVIVVLYDPKADKVLLIEEVRTCHRASCGEQPTALCWRR